MTTTATARSITICAASFPPEKGGAPTRIYNLARLLVDSGYCVRVITAMPNYPAGTIFPGYRGRLLFKEVVDGIEVTRLWLIPSNAGSIFLRAASLVSYLLALVVLAFPRLLFRRTDAVIISSPPLVTAWATALMARIAGKKIIVNISDIWPLTATEMGALKVGFLLGVLQRLERQLYRMAGAYTGQSREILAHIRQTAVHNRPAFLYRNLQESATAHNTAAPPPSGQRKIIYAGNLGHAQGMLALCRAVSFSGVALHIYGDGAERPALQSLIEQEPERNIYLHHTITQSALNEVLATFDAVLIPLKTNIHGAVPSKLFMAVANGLPVLFCGGGEGEQLVREHGLGWVSPPGDYPALQDTLREMAELDATAFNQVRGRIAVAGNGAFSKKVQDSAFLSFLDQYIRRSERRNMPDRWADSALPFEY